MGSKQRMQRCFAIRLRDIQIMLTTLTKFRRYCYIFFNLNLMRYFVFYSNRDLIKLEHINRDIRCNKSEKFIFI